MEKEKARIVSEMKSQRTLNCRLGPAKDMISELGVSLKKNQSEYSTDI